MAEQRIIWELDLDTAKFDDAISQKLKDITKLNTKELKQLEQKLGVLEKIALKYEALSKAKGLDPKQTAQVTEELKKVEKAYKAIEKTANPPKQKQKDPLLDGTAAKAIQKTEKAFVKFGKVASGKVKDVADEIIALSKSGENLEISEKYTEQLGKAEEAMQALKIATSELRKENRELLKSGKGLSDEEQKRLEENAKAIAQNENLTKKLGLAIRRLKKDYAVIDEGTDSIDAQQAEVQRLQAQYFALSKVQRESAEGQELKKQIADLASEINEAKIEVGRFENNIGNYKASIIAAAQETEGFGATVSGTIKGIVNASRVLLANPLFLLASILAGVVALVGKAVASSERGSKLLSKAFNTVNAVFLVLVRTVDKVIGAIENISFESITQGFKDLGETIKNAVIDRLNLAIDVLRKLWAGEFKEAGKSAVEFAKKINPLTTALNAASEAVSNVNQELTETTKALNDFDELQKRVTKSNAQLTVSLALQTAEVEKLTQAADNDTKAWGEREQAARDAGVAIERQSKLEIQRAKNNLAVIQSQFNLAAGTKDQIGLEQELADAKAALIEAEAAQIVNREENNERLAKIISDRLEIELDVFLDYTAKRSDANLQLIESDELSLEARRKLLEDTRKLNEDAFKEQIAVINQVSKEKIAIQDFENAETAKQFLERLRQLEASEKFETRTLEVFRDRIEILQSLIDAEKALNEAEKERSAQRVENEEQAQKTVLELTEEIETKRLEFLAASQEQQTANARRENDLRLRDIENTYDALREAARENAEQDLFSQEKLSEYLTALDKLEKRAKEVQSLALQKELFAINEAALREAIESAERVASETISTEVERVAAENIVKLVEAFQKGEISYKQYQDRLTQIQKTAAAQRRNEELKSLELQLAELQARISASEAQRQGLSIFDPEKVLSDEDLQKAKQQIEKLRTEIAKLEAEASQADFTPEPDPQGKIGKFISFYQQIEAAALQTFRNITAEQIRQADRALSIQEQRIETAKEFFRKGNEDYLAQEEARQIELERRRERAVRRQQAIDRAAQISSVLTGLVQEFGKGGLTGAGAALAGLTALLTIVPNLIPTPQSFAEGGFTGKGILPADETGYRPAGVVHENEYVIPSKVLKTKEGMQKAQELEAMRLGRASIPRFNYDRINQAVQVQTNNARLESKISEMIEEQRATRQEIAAMKMHVSLDADGFAAHQAKLAERKRREML